MWMCDELNSHLPPGTYTFYVKHDSNAVIRFFFLLSILSTIITKSTLSSTVHLNFVEWDWRDRRSKSRSSAIGHTIPRQIESNRIRFGSMSAKWSNSNLWKFRVLFTLCCCRCLELLGLGNLHFLLVFYSLPLSSYLPLSLSESPPLFIWFDKNVCFRCQVCDKILNMRYRQQQQQPSLSSSSSKQFEKFNATVQFYLHFNL